MSITSFFSSTFSSMMYLIIKTPSDCILSKSFLTLPMLLFKGVTKYQNGLMTSHYGIFCIFNICLISKWSSSLLSGPYSLNISQTLVSFAQNCTSKASLLKSGTAIPLFPLTTIYSRLWKLRLASISSVNGFIALM